MSITITFVFSYFVLLEYTLKKNSQESRFLKDGLDDSLIELRRDDKIVIVS